jgi:ribosomal protein S18 acetylase RimI-like enzyme
MMHARTETSKILANAFLHYPLMLYAFEGCSESQRLKLLHHLYYHCVRASAMYGGVITNQDGSGALIWLSGESFPMGLWHEVKAGMWALPFRLGLKATLRLVGHDSTPENWIKNYGDNKIGYIWCVGVNANARGQGLSRKLVEEGISEMKQLGMETFWLKTEDPKNVAIYQKLGFEVVNEMIVKGSGLKSWMMKRA